MKTVWKFALETTDDQVVEMPCGAQVVHIAAQGDTICVWAIVHTDNDLTSLRRFQIVGTGNPAPEFAEYLGTAHVGPFVWHVFGARQ